MKTFFVLVLLFIAFLIPDISYSVDTSSNNYLPLKIGNRFVYTYQYQAYPPNDTLYKFRVSIERDSIINNKQYFYCNGAPWGNGWFRTDTINKAIYKYDETNSCGPYYYEKLIDSLVALPDGWSRCGNSIRSSIIIPSSFFGIQASQLYVGIFFYTFVSIWKRYHLNFGLTEYVYNSRYSSSSYTLKGCVINGNVYGDTSIPVTGIHQINNEFPVEFSLSQNYPNPFNPQTKVKFSIPLSPKGSLTRGVTADGGRGVFVSLIIYDLLGREITILVNEELRPGTYEADWDASNYSSGVYFYKIISGDFVETKKMVLMK